MPGEISRIKHIGSFQYNYQFRSDNPLEEVWSQIKKYGSERYVFKKFSQWKDNTDRDKHIKYATLRIRQAVEFRELSKNKSLLTTPLPLYYSFLNLLRAYLALCPEIIPKPRHGLKYQTGKDIFSSKAQLVEGTFTDYLDLSSTVDI